MNFFEVFYIVYNWNDRASKPPLVGFEVQVCEAIDYWYKVAAMQKERFLINYAMLDLAEDKESLEMSLNKDLMSKDCVVFSWILQGQTTSLLPCRNLWMGALNRRLRRRLS